VKKLYTVELTTCIVVLAKSIEEAEEKGMFYGRYEEPDSSASEMTHIPGDWELECIPYGDDKEEKTIKTLIEEGAAPAYVETMKKLCRKIT